MRSACKGGQSSSRGENDGGKSTGALSEEEDEVDDEVTGRIAGVRGRAGEMLHFHFVMPPERILKLFLNSYGLFL
jgi:hypothetical protein